MSAAGPSTTLPAAAGEDQMRLPAGQFFFAVLDMSAIPRRLQRSHQALGYLFESSLPVPIDDVQASYAPLRSGRVLACGMPRDRLQAIVAEHGADLVSVAPDALPIWLDEPSTGSLALERLNLLHGRFLPPPVRTLQRRLFISAIAAILLCSATLIGGLERRTRHLNARRAAVHEAAQGVYEEVLGPTTIAVGSQPPPLRLVGELRQLQRTRRTDAAALADPDASLALQAILQRWPADLHALTHSISAAATTLSINATVPTSSDAQALADSLSATDGWALQQPRIATVRDGVQVNIQLKRPDTPEAGQ